MSHLIALIFDDPFKGEEALATVHRMAGDGLLDLEDSVLIKNSQDGHFLLSRKAKSSAKLRKPDIYWDWWRQQ